MKNILISFVVPCFNVERYIEECLDSIYAQGVSEEVFEVICVDDASPDNVYGLLERYMKKHSNLKVVRNVQNMGWGGARNAGIRNAKGEYIWFVDADDLIEHNILKKIIEVILHDKPDVLLANYRIIDEDQKTISIVNHFAYFEVKNGVDFIYDVIGLHKFNYYFGFVWRSIYKLSYIRYQNIMFPEHTSWEDTVFLPIAIYNASLIVSLPIVIYQYRRNQYSVSAEYKKMQNVGLIYQYHFVAGWMMIDFWQKVESNDIDIANEIKRMALCKYLNSFWLSLARLSKERLKEFFEIIDDNRQVIVSLWPYFNIVSRLLLNKYIGYYASNILRIVYHVKHYSINK